MGDKINTKYDTKTTDLADGSILATEGSSLSVTYNTYSLMGGIASVAVVLGIFTFMRFRR